MNNIELFENQNDYEIFMSTVPYGNVDIIVTSFNGFDINKQCLEHLQKNTPENGRIVWVENGSTDGSHDLVKKELNNNFKNFIFIPSKYNRGVIGGRNLGLKVISAINGRSDPLEYVLFLDNDQFVGSGWLDRHLSFMKDGKYDMIGVEAWLMNEQLLPEKKVERKGDYFTYVSCCAMMLTRNALDKIGIYFDEVFNPAYFEDPDFAFRANELGLKIGCDSQSKILHMSHGTLGQNKERYTIFANSYKNFVKKWKGKVVPRFRM